MKDYYNKRKHTLELCLDSRNHELELRVLKRNEHVLGLYRFLSGSSSIFHGAVFDIDVSI